MERIVDKAIIAVCCLAAFFLIPSTTVFVVGFLLALAVSAFQETSLAAKKVIISLPFIYLIAAVFLPEFVLLTPLMSYDCMKRKNWMLKLCWLIPYIVGSRVMSVQVLVLVGLIALLSCILSWRAARIGEERLANKALRDELRELSLSLEQKNHELQEKQDYEVRLATLAERGRIAREIHDNVGHLLTRSVLQIEAAQVVHADEPQVREDLEQVGATIHEAFDTVRASVHDLHDDSFDLYTQLYGIVQDSTVDLELDYQVENVPDGVGYGFVAIVREAVANAIKHSDASRVKVSVAEYPAFWQLVVHDNGSKDPFMSGTYRTDSLSQRAVLSSQRTGPSSQNPSSLNLLSKSAKTEGIGLSTMEERTRSLGGIFRIDYDKGFSVFVSVPKTTAEEHV